ncbi:MAG: hypothetical protein JWM32_1823 [Verrucomicrobia bacterium]|nr:hypothetical protein [Verrucomicrobiota bacterium]
MQTEPLPFERLRVDADALGKTRFNLSDRNFGAGGPPALLQSADCMNSMLSPLGPSQKKIRTGTAPTPLFD